MKTNFVNIDGTWVIATGNVLVYETNNAPVFNEDHELIEYDDYDFADEVIDICTGTRYAYIEAIHNVGNPVDSFKGAPRQNPKRGRHSKSHNKTTWRKNNPVWKRFVNDDCPF